MRKWPVRLFDKKLPIDNERGYEVVYDYRKRTSGGFVDAIILGSVMFTGFMWLMMMLALGK